MNPIQIGRKRLSDIIWDLLDEKTTVDWSAIQNIVDKQQHLREQADYNTGSLSEGDAADLHKIVSFFKPDVVAEVGTFIGVSTNIIYRACKGAVIHIHTCDGSNDIKLELPVTQYPKTMSHDMFKAMAEKGIKVDLVYLDGRLGQEDIEPLNKVLAPHTVFVLDDFEGIEKGVVNALMLESPGRALIYPREGMKTAMSIPLSLLQVVSQESN
jgi:hypothetical protein